MSRGLSGAAAETKHSTLGIPVPKQGNDRKAIQELAPQWWCPHHLHQLILLENKLGLPDIHGRWRQICLWKTRHQHCYLLRTEPSTYQNTFWGGGAPSPSQEQTLGWPGNIWCPNCHLLTPRINGKRLAGATIHQQNVLGSCESTRPSPSNRDSFHILECIPQSSDPGPESGPLSSSNWQMYVSRPDFPETEPAYP